MARQSPLGYNLCSQVSAIHLKTGTHWSNLRVPDLQLDKNDLILKLSHHDSNPSKNQVGIPNQTTTAIHFNMS